MLNLLAPLFDDLAKARIDLSPGRYGLLTACDGGLLEVSGLSAPVGALCKVAHGRAAPLTAIQAPMSLYPNLGDLFWHVPVEDSGNNGVVRLVFDAPEQRAA